MKVVSSSPLYMMAVDQDSSRMSRRKRYITPLVLLQVLRLGSDMSVSLHTLIRLSLR